MVPPSVKYQNISHPRGVDRRRHRVELRPSRPQRPHRQPGLLDDADGPRRHGASVWVGAVVRPLEARWAVRISLPPGRSAMDVDILTMAPQVLPGMMYWWTNSAVEVARTASSTTTATTPATGTPHSWPMLDGPDFSWYRNRTFGADMFLMEPQRDYIGFYDFGRHHGLAPDGRPVPGAGAEVLHLGLRSRGRYWDLLLSDSEQTYCEIQRGRLPTQGVTEPIPPMSVRLLDARRGSRSTRPRASAALENDLVVSVNPDGEKAAIGPPAERRAAQGFARRGLRRRWVDRDVDGRAAAARACRPSTGSNWQGQACRRREGDRRRRPSLMDWTSLRVQGRGLDEALQAVRRGQGQPGGAVQGGRAQPVRWPGRTTSITRSACTRRSSRWIRATPARCGRWRRSSSVAGRLDKAEERIREGACSDGRWNRGCSCCWAGHWSISRQADEAVDTFMNAGRYEPNRRNGLIGADFGVSQGRPVRRGRRAGGPV